MHNCHERRADAGQGGGRRYIPLQIRMQIDTDGEDILRANV